MISLRAIASVVTFILTSAGIAAAAPATTMPLRSWTGVYLGVGGGYGWADQTIKNFPVTDLGPFPADFVGDFSDSPSGGVFGGQADFLYQMPNNLVAGIGVQLGWGSISGSGKLTEDGGSETSSYTNTLKNFQAVTGRLGLAMGSWLPYATAGLVTAENQLNVNAGGGLYSGSAIHAGWLLGAGLQLVLRNNWSLWAEYDYADLGTVSYQSVGFDEPGGPSSIGLTAQWLMAGLSYKIGGQK